MIRQNDPHKRGKASRDKGARAERELAKTLREWWGYDVHRGKVFYGESDIVGLDGIHIECKWVENLNLRKAMKQAEEESEKRKDGLPAVFHKKDHEEWLVTMRLEDWADLYGAWKE